MSIAVGAGAWTCGAVQAASANKMIVNEKILFIFSFFLLFQVWCNLSFS
jgi:hypothetical protein